MAQAACVRPGICWLQMILLRLGVIFSGGCRPSSEAGTGPEITVCWVYAYSLLVPGSNVNTARAHYRAARGRRTRRRGAWARYLCQRLVRFGFLGAGRNAGHGVAAEAGLLRGSGRGRLARARYAGSSAAGLEEGVATAPRMGTRRNASLGTVFAGRSPGSSPDSLHIPSQDRHKVPTREQVTLFPVSPRSMSSRRSGLSPRRTETGPGRSRRGRRASGGGAEAARGGSGRYLRAPWEPVSERELAEPGRPAVVVSFQGGAGGALTAAGGSRPPGARRWSEEESPIGAFLLV